MAAPLLRAPDGSLEQFITEHYWGYASQPDKSCLEYQVAHDPWRIWKATAAVFEGSPASLYGEKLAKSFDSASRAIASAETGLADLRVFLIQSDLYPSPTSTRVTRCRYSPSSSSLTSKITEYSRSHPADGQKLLRNVGSTIEPIRTGKQIPRLLEPDATPGIRPEASALSSVEAKAHLI
ncbi:MAG: DUF2071 domain-containing protein [Bryobacteraceae bacterium]